MIHSTLNMNHSSRQILRSNRDSAMSTIMSHIHMVRYKLLHKNACTAGNLSDCSPKYSLFVPHKHNFCVCRPSVLFFLLSCIFCRIMRYFGCLRSIFQLPTSSARNRYIYIITHIHISYRRTFALYCARSMLWLGIWLNGFYSHSRIQDKLPDNIRSGGNVCGSVWVWEREGDRERESYVSIYR